MDSAVKYLGVEVGSVEKIRIAPDNNLIEVVMKINLRRDLARDAVAQLRSAGITGMVFIELDRRDPAKPDLSPKLNFASEYPIISSQPSQLKQLFSGIEEVVDNLKEVDTKGISDEIKITIKSIGNLVSGEKMDHIMIGVDSSVSNVREITEKVNNVLTEKKLDDVLVEAKNSLLKVQNLVEDVQGKLNSMNLHKTGANLENATARIDKISGFRRSRSDSWRGKRGDRQRQLGHRENQRRNRIHEAFTNCRKSEHSARGDRPEKRCSLKEPDHDP